MRLLKLIAYCIVGYAIYEFYQGMKSQPTGAARGGRGRGTGRGQGQESFAGHEERGQRMTGPSGAGMTERTEDATGTGGTHIVGRGVVTG